MTDRLCASLLDGTRPLALYAFMEFLCDSGVALPAWLVRLAVALDGPIVEATLHLREEGVSGS